MMYRNSMDACLKELSRFIDHMGGVSAECCVEALEETFGKALEYTPQDTGDLRASGYLEAETFRGNAVAVIGFGRGGNPSYAVYVHEMPFAHKAPTRSKFLQAALDEDMGEIESKLAASVKYASGV
ncbi:hypothetical protein, partial [Parvimonas sp. M13]